MDLRSTHTLGVSTKSPTVSVTLRRKEQWLNEARSSQRKSECTDEIWREREREREKERDESACDFAGLQCVSLSTAVRPFDGSQARVLFQPQAARAALGIASVYDHQA